MDETLFELDFLVRLGRRSWLLSLGGFDSVARVVLELLGELLLLRLAERLVSV